MMGRFRWLAAAVTLLVAGAGVAVWREARRAGALGSGPGVAGGRTERCLVCHGQPHEDPGGPHAAEALGCSSCHLGNPLAFTAARAHDGMEPEPGALRTVQRTCGRPGCHEREARSVTGSLMTTGVGIIGVDRWAFGEQPTPDGKETLREVMDLQQPSPAQDHVRRLCAGCHLGTTKTNRDDAVSGNGSGCSACHAPRRLAGEADGRLAPGALAGSPAGGAAAGQPDRRNHPPVDARGVDDGRCLGCHSRSGRVSLSYQGLAEVAGDGLARCADPVTLYDGRPGCRLTDDAHHAKGLGCVDCHLHTETMGDGTAHAHEQQQVEITCEACHPPAGGGAAGTRGGSTAARRPAPAPAAIPALPPGPAELTRPPSAATSECTDSHVAQSTWGAVHDPVTRDILRMRGETRPAAEAVRLGERGTPIWNLRPAGARGAGDHRSGVRPAADARPPAARGASPGRAPWILYGKSDGRPHPSPATPVDANHGLRGHERLSCASCHARWAPTCATCHTTYDAKSTQWDFGAAGVRRGSWRETSSGFGWGSPALAVDRANRIVPAVPGMVMRVDGHQAGGSTLTRRLFAPLDPHTTAREARPCADCHLSPAALGLGDGSLSLTAEGPRFSPTADDPDTAGMARGAWVRLYPERPGTGTRPGLRSLDSVEQWRLLRAGACVRCHARAADPIYRDFGAAVVRLLRGGTSCALTPWPWLAGPPRLKLEAGTRRRRTPAGDRTEQ